MIRWILCEEKSMLMRLYVIIICQIILYPVSPSKDHEIDKIIFRFLCIVKNDLLTIIPYIYVYVCVTQRPKQRNANDTFSIANHKYWCKQQKMQFNSNTRFASEWKTDREWMNKSRFYRTGGIRFCAGDIHARHKKRVTSHNKCRMKCKQQ